MTNEQALSSLLSDFARTMVTELPIGAILEQLVERIVDVLPIDAAGATLMSAGSAPRVVVGSDAAALRLEHAQTELADGPSAAAFASGRVVAVPDLRRAHPFPLFARRALDAGLGAVFTFPLGHGSERVGTLDLYRQTPGPLDARDMATARAVADVAAAYLLNAQSRDDARDTARRLHHTTLHDPLTGLSNRTLLAERLDAARRRPRRPGTYAAILFIDIDNFKHVNDSYGHHVGDDLLVAIAQRMAGAVRDCDTLARFAGDEFVLLCEDLDAAAEATAMADRIEAAFADPFAVAGGELLVTASIGIAVADTNEEISDELVVRADQAMYQVKRKGGGEHQALDVAEAMRTSAALVLRRELGRAHANRELDVAYQPIVRVCDGHTVGVEALLRWCHPVRGHIPAVDMVRAAESTRLITDIGLWVLERACRDHAGWTAAGHSSGLQLAVNVSVRQLLDPAFPGQVDAVFEATGMAPASVVLEVTESVLVEHHWPCAAALDRLKSLGVRIALDDFGTGYSSLSCLDRLPIDIVKFDRGFVEGIETTARRGTVVSAIRRLAGDLGLGVVAEGVETQRQHDVVAVLGCDHAQGYFYARPTTAVVIEAHLAEQAEPALAGRPATSG